MSNHKSIGECIVSIAKKAHKAVDQEKLKSMQTKMVKKSIPFFAVGAVIILIGLVTMFIGLINSYEEWLIRFIYTSIILVGAIILSIGGFYYRTGKQLFFGGDILENLTSGRVCPKCGENCGENAVYCEKCGAKLLKSKICHYCGKQNEEDAEFCIHCGKKIVYKNKLNQKDIYNSW